jgi:hypothetical protein
MDCTTSDDDSNGPQIGRIPDTSIWMGSLRRAPKPTSPQILGVVRGR